jgi:hypothetical protein
MISTALHPSVYPMADFVPFYPCFPSTMANKSLDEIMVKMHCAK